VSIPDRREPHHGEVIHGPQSECVPRAGAASQFVRSLRKVMACLYCGGGGGGSLNGREEGVRQEKG
jgi:hypothetical protein